MTFKRISGEAERWTIFQRKCQILWWLYKQQVTGQGEAQKYSTKQLATACGLKVTQWFRARLYELEAEGVVTRSTTPYRANVDKDLWQFKKSARTSSLYRSFFNEAIATEKARENA